MARVETVREIREILVALTHRYAFREISYLVGGGVTGMALTQREVARVQQLCAYGQRLFDLDAEDFDKPDAAFGATTDTTIAELVRDERVPGHLVERGRRYWVRQTGDGQPRGALESLYPTYELFLELVAARWLRREMVALVVTAHLAAEYAPMLAWQRILGHGGDPLELEQNPAFAGPQSHWGRYDDSDCPHTQPQRSAAARTLRVMREPPSGWRNYVHRQHSIVAYALGVCAAECRTPCTVMTSLTGPERAEIAEACRVAAAYRNCALVRLRHTAPSGHGFGVPSPEEVTDAWQRSREGIARRGGLALAAMTEDGYPLPGLPSLLSAIAGRPLVADSVLLDTATEVITAIDPDDVARPTSYPTGV
jgi:hypothetical protein